MTIIISSSCHDVVNNIVGGTRQNGVKSFRRGSATISLGAKLFADGNNEKVLGKNKFDQTLNSNTRNASIKNKKQVDGNVDQENEKGMYETFLEVIPQPIRFLISGCIGNLVFFALDQYLYKNVFIGKDTASFFVAYLMQIFLQHSLNAFFVYGLETISTRVRYIETLSSTYSAYFGTLLASTAFNSLLAKYTPIPKIVAFWATLAIFSVVNFFILGKLVEGSSTSVENNIIGNPSSIHNKKDFHKNSLKRSRGGATSSTSIMDFIHGIFQKENKQHFPSIILSLFLPQKSFPNNESDSFRGQF